LGQDPTECAQAHVDPEAAPKFLQGRVGIGGDQVGQALALGGAESGRGTAGVRPGCERTSFATPLEEAPKPGFTDEEQGGDLGVIEAALVTGFGDTLAEVKRVGFHAGLLSSCKLSTAQLRPLHASEIRSRHRVNL
jgi:hypothetical protein